MTPWKVFSVLTLLCSVLVIEGCRPSTNLPAKSSPEYNELVRTFYIGLAALEVGHDVQADAKLSQFTQLAQAEPAGWANWGLLALRQRNYEIAAERLQRARDLAPQNSDVRYLIGLLESSRGNNTEAIKELRKAVELDQSNLIATYKLAEEVERQGDENSAKEFQELIQQILVAQPDNLAAQVELSRVAAKRGEVETLKSTLSKIKARSSSWPPEIKERLVAIEESVASGEMNAAATRTSFLKNVLVQLPEYRQTLAAFKPPPGEEAVPFDHFLRLETPSFTNAAPDTSLSFQESEMAGASAQDWIGAVSLDGSGAPIIVTANAREVRLTNGPSFPFPGGPSAARPRANGLLAIDFNYDFKTDLVLAGAGGVRWFRQDGPTAFSDVTTQTKLPAAVVNASYTGGWSADIEADGDLDIVLGSEQGPPVCLRNNGDGSFLQINPFSGVSGLRDFAWADLDADGDPDAALIDGSGKLRVFSNERQGQFVERSIPADLAATDRINIADMNDDGVLDSLALQNTGNVLRLSDKNEGREWETAEIARTSAPAGAEDVRLLVSDIENKGGFDLVVSTNSA
jgi:tetratricopeptide (TPR) repeat protein